VNEERNIPPTIKGRKEGRKEGAKRRHWNLKEESTDSIMHGTGI
jgi:hypothetical protein